MSEREMQSLEIQRLFPDNLRHDPNHTLDGMLVLRCIFCNMYQTPIEFDMANHLRETHHEGLLTDLPLQGKGYDMYYRARLAIDIMRNSEPKVFYDHRTAEFAPPPPIYVAEPRERYKKKEVVRTPRSIKKVERKELPLSLN